eukprot:TRINITY_DN13011_c0_g1_i1.p1 TRINITY_DN13011_c0_g1~~TRINITY_DN13011_c0_g1_i1.p1  ORF type:complete len:314 (+),score=13.16 TRINITY_DN13011_c0_g1_i1:76-1017(+)
MAIYLPPQPVYVNSAVQSALLEQALLAAELQRLQLETLAKSCRNQLAAARGSGTHDAPEPATADATVQSVVSHTTPCARTCYEVRTAPLTQVVHPDSPVWASHSSRNPVPCPPAAAMDEASAGLDVQPLLPLSSPPLPPTPLTTPVSDHRLPAAGSASHPPVHAYPPPAHVDREPEPWDTPASRSPRHASAEATKLNSSDLRSRLQQVSEQACGPPTGSDGVSLAAAAVSGLFDKGGLRLLQATSPPRRVPTQARDVRWYRSQRQGWGLMMLATSMKPPEPAPARGLYLLYRAGCETLANRGSGLTLLRQSCP